MLMLVYAANDEQEYTGGLHTFPAPHVGHLYSMVLADIIKRWQLLSGKKALLCTGTDEHGMKVSMSCFLLTEWY